jgi:hypothetical protein
MIAQTYFFFQEFNEDERERYHSNKFEILISKYETSTKFEIQITTKTIAPADHHQTELNVFLAEVIHHSSDEGFVRQSRTQVCGLQKVFRPARTQERQEGIRLTAGYRLASVWIWVLPGVGHIVCLMRFKNIE